MTDLIYIRSLIERVVARDQQDEIAHLHSKLTTIINNLKGKK